MNFDSARIAVYDALSAGWGSHSTVTIFREGTPLPDLSTRTTPFILVSVRSRRSKQMGMVNGANKPRRVQGVAEFYIYTPEVSSPITRNGCLETLDNLFTAKTISSIVFGESVTPSPVTAVGWTSQGFLCSFYFDKL